MYSERAMENSFHCLQNPGSEEVRFLRMTLSLLAKRFASNHSLFMICSSNQARHLRAI